MATITAELTQGTVVHISDGRHQWRADEPPSAGGTDSAPNPYELLLGSLAACTCITVSLYSQHKGIELQSVTARYEFSRIHARDCEDCDEGDKGFIDLINSQVHIKGDLDDGQRERLAQIVGRCPVHKTLEKGVRIADEVVFD